MESRTFGMKDRVDEFNNVASNSVLAETSVLVNGRSALAAGQ